MPPLIKRGKQYQVSEVLKKTVQKREEDQPRMKVSGTQADAGLEGTCPPSHPQDSRVEYGEGGPLPQVTWRH